MNIEFESLKLLPKIFELLEKLNANLETAHSKRWMSVKELSLYLTFSKDKIYKMVDIQFIESEHYYKKENRLLFDKEKIDEWILKTSTNKLSTQDTQLLIDNILSNVSKA